MMHILNLQAHDDDGQDSRSPSTWSIIGCASTFSVGAC